MSAKKFFKIIGVVFGSVLVLAGAIFGVMAAMGYFRTDPVYADKLEFENTYIRVLYDDTKPNEIHKFKVNGISNSGEEVNQYSCYLQEYLANYPKQEQSLITLCDQNGTPLNISSSEGYKINCNNDTYFKINANAFNLADYTGLAQFIAVGDKASYSLTSSTTTPITIAVDRKITSVFAKDIYGNVVNASNSANGGMQTINVGVNQQLAFDYAVSPSASALSPILGVEAKQVYLYYHYADANGDHYERITKDNCSNYSFLDYDNDNNKIVFIAPTTSNVDFNFMLAAYPSYDSYYAANSQAPVGYDQIKKVVNTTLTIKVENTKITDVVLNSEPQVISSYLYKDTKISVNGNSADGISLGMQFVGENAEDRYNSIKFNAVNSGAWTTHNINFVNTETSEALSITGYTNLTERSFTVGNKTYWLELDKVVYTNSSVGRRTLIKSISDEDDNVFVAANGAVFLCREGNTYRIQMLQSGEYFDFFYNFAGSYTLADDFKYEVIENKGDTEVGANKSWTITPMSTIEQANSMCLAIFVVNNDGSYHFKPVTSSFNVNEEAFDYTLTANEIALELGFNNGNQTYSSHTFDSLVKQKYGSYSANVFVVEYNSLINYPFELLKLSDNSIATFVFEGTTYAIVGGSDRMGFVNQILANDNRVSKEDAINIYVMQFKNNFNQNTVAFVNTNVLNQSNLINLGSLVNLVNKTDFIKVSSDYMLTNNLFSSQFTADDSLTVEGSAVTALEKSAIEHTLTISTNIANLFEKVDETKLTLQVRAENGAVEEDVINFVNNGSEHDFTIDRVNNTLVVNFTINGVDGTSYTINLLYNNEVVYTTDAINLVSNDASEVYFYYDANNQNSRVRLLNNGADNGEYILVNIAYDKDTNDYVYKYSLVLQNRSILLDDFVLNSNSEKPGFYATTVLNSAALSTISYSTDQESVATVSGNRLVINSLNQTNICVRIDGQTWRIKLVVEVKDNSFALEATKLDETTQPTSNLSQFVSYTYNDTSIPLNNVSITNVLVEDFGASYSTYIYSHNGDGNYVLGDPKNGNTVVKGATNIKIMDAMEGYNPKTILTITKGGNDWTIERGLDFWYTYIRLQITVSAITQQNPTSVTIDFNNSLNIFKNNQYNEMYFANTSVVLAEVVGENGNFETSSVFKIQDMREVDSTNTAAANIDIYYTYSKTLPTGEEDETKIGTLNVVNNTKLTTKFTTTGYYTYIFKVAGSVAFSSTIIVKENSFAVVDTNENNSLTTLNTAGNYNLVDLLDFFSFNSDIVFGQDADYTNFNNWQFDTMRVEASDVKVIVVGGTTKTTIATGTTNIADINLVSADKKTEPTLSISKEAEGQILKVGVIKELNKTAESRSFKLNFNENDALIVLQKVNSNITVLEKIDATINNQTTFVWPTEVNSGYDKTNMRFDWKTYTQYDANGFKTNLNNYNLTNIAAANNIKIVLLDADNNVIVDPTTNTIINKFYFVIDDESIDDSSYSTKLTFTFTNKDDSADKLSYTTVNENDGVNLVDAVIKPFKPETNKNISAIVGNSFDLINSVFVNDFYKNQNIFTSLAVESVDGANIIANTNYLGGITLKDGAEQIWETRPTEVQFNEFVGNTKLIKINYVLRFENGTIYRFSVPVIVNNSQAIDINYPYYNITSSTASAVSVNFASSATEEDFAYFGITESTQDGVYEVEFDQFEAVYLGKANTSVTIKFDYDNVLSLNRVVVKDANTGLEQNSELSISPLAWWSGSTFDTFRTTNITYPSNSVTFSYPQGNQDWSDAYMIFKISTSNGAVGYYKVGIFYTNDRNSVVYNADSTAVQVVNIYANSTKTSFVTTSTSEDVTNVSIFGSDGFNFKQAFNTDYNINRIRFYLTSAEYINGESAFGLISVNKQNEDDTTSKVPAKTGDNLAGATLSESVNYATLKIVVMYIDNNKAVNLGTIVANLQPTIYAVAKEDAKSTLNLQTVSNKADHEGNFNTVSYDSGYYQATISTSKPIEVPFILSGNTAVTNQTVRVVDLSSGFVWDEDSMAIYYGTLPETDEEKLNNKVIALNGNTLVLSNYTNTSLSFTVEYTLSYSGNSVNVYVVYTLPATTLPKETIRIPLGGYQNGEFNNTIYFDKNIISGYNLNINIANRNSLQTGASNIPVVGNSTAETKLDNVFEGLVYTYENEMLAVKLPLKSSPYTLYLTITLNNYINANKTIQLEINVSSPMQENNYASSEATPALTEATKNYTSEMGSKIVVVSETSGDITTFEFLSGNSTFAKITTLKGNKLELAFTLNDQPADEYVLLNSSEGYKTLKDLGKTIIDLPVNNDSTREETTIGFAHIANNNVILKLTVKVYALASDNSKDYYQRNIVSYVKLAQTYLRLNKQNEIVGSSYDIVYAESDYYNTSKLFSKEGLENDRAYSATGSTAVYNSWRIGLIDATGVSVASDKFDLSKMGFTNPNNINFIQFTEGNSLVELSQDGSTLSFKTPANANNNSTYVTLSNRAGINNLQYNFRILPKDAQLIYGDNVYTKEGTNTSYLSTLVTGTNYSSNNFAKLADSNNQLFYIKNNLKVSTNDGNFDNPEATQYSKGITLDNGYIGDQLTVWVNGTNSQTSTYATISMYSNNISVEIHNINNINKLIIKLTIFGSCKVAEDFEIVFQNYEVTQQTTKTYYGGDTILVNDLFKVNQILNGTEQTNNNIQYILSDISYTLLEQGATRTIRGEDAKGLFDKIASNENLIDSERNELYLATLAVDATLNLSFRVVLDGYVLASPEVKNVPLKSNLALVNNQTLVTGQGINYVMTASGLTTTTETVGDVTTTTANFPYTLNLTGGVGGSVDINGTSYQNEINLAFAHPRDTSRIYTFAKDALVTYNNISVDAAFEGIVEIVNPTAEGETVAFGLRFLKDFNGELKVYIRVELGVRGNITHNVVLHIKGFADVDYFGSENAVIGENGAGLTSGATVMAVSNVNSTESNTNIKLVTTYAKEINSKKLWPDNSKIVYKYQYITSFSYYSPVSQMWEDNKESKVEGTGILEESTVEDDPSIANPFIRVELPYNASNSRMYVVYKFTFNYLGVEVEKYATYAVAGMNININPSTEDGKFVVNVDSAAAEFDPESKDQTFGVVKVKGNGDDKNKNYLPLFYFTNKFTHTLTNESGTPISTTTYNYSTNEAGKRILTVTSGEETKVYEYQALTDRYVRTEGEGENIKEFALTYPNDSNKIIAYENGKENENRISVTSDSRLSTLYKLPIISSELNFTSFMDGLGKVAFTNVTEGDANAQITQKQFEIVEIPNASEGYLIYGIDLGDSTLFNNTVSLSINVTGAGGVILQSNNITFKGDKMLTPASQMRLREIFEYETPYTENVSIIAITNSSIENLKTSNEAIGWINTTNLGGLSVNVKDIRPYNMPVINYNGQTLTIYQVTYEAVGAENSLYSLEDTFYYAYNEKAEIVIVQSQNSTFNLTCNGTNNGSAEYTITLNNFLKRWSYNNTDGFKNVLLGSDYEIAKADPSEAIKVDGNTITVSENFISPNGQTTSKTLAFSVTIDSNLQLNIYVRFNYFAFVS